LTAEIPLVSSAWTRDRPLREPIAGAAAGSTIAREITYGLVIGDDFVASHPGRRAGL
jgi:hypothetical protein